MAQRLSTGLLLCLCGGSLTPAGCCGKSGLGGEGRHLAVAKQGSYCWIEHSAPLPVKQSIFYYHSKRTIAQSSGRFYHVAYHGLIFWPWVKQRHLDSMNPHVCKSQGARKESNARGAWP